MILVPSAIWRKDEKACPASGLQRCFHSVIMNDAHTYECTRREGMGQDEDGGQRENLATEIFSLGKLHFHESNPS